MRVFWDTNLFIYVLEPFGHLSAQTLELLDRMTARGDVLMTSTLSVGEACVAPARVSTSLAVAYRGQIERLAQVIQSFDEAAAARYSVVRRDSAIRSPDAIQLACAAQARADLFITNDMRLSRRVVPGVPMISSLATSPI